MACENIVELLINCFYDICTVKKQKSEGSIPESVMRVLDIEMEKLYSCQDANKLNEEFLSKNVNSVLHRAAGNLVSYAKYL
jgi:hypothetical protein